MDGSGLVPFDVTTPLDTAEIAAHVAYAHSLGLPRAPFRFPKLTVITGGPTARHAPLDPLGTTLALNGALSLFTERGLAPTYYACCDPQALVADFLREAPESTAYYVASKCHPDVFAALAGRNVTVFDTDDHVPGGIASAPSITLQALNLFVALGWRDFDVWGWDCCDVDGEHHAAGGTRPGDPRRAQIAAETFDTTDTWLFEAQSAAQVLPILEYVGCIVNIRGPSMVRAAYRAINGRDLHTV